MKTSYKKIDIYVGGQYRCSTTWSATCRDAKARYLMVHAASMNRDNIEPSSVKCRFAKD